MTDEQRDSIRQLIDKVKPVTIRNSKNMYHKEWEYLFALYNANNTPKLQMRCHGWEEKVLKWIKEAVEYNFQFPPNILQ